MVGYGGEEGVDVHVLVKDVTMRVWSRFVGESFGCLEFVHKLLEREGESLEVLRIKFKALYPLLSPRL